MVVSIYSNILIITQVLTERGVDIRGMLKKDMEDALSRHPDFAAEKSEIEMLLTSRGHLCFFTPKFHCELK